MLYFFLYLVLPSALSFVPLSHSVHGRRRRDVIGSFDKSVVMKKREIDVRLTKSYKNQEEKKLISESLSSAGLATLAAVLFGAYIWESRGSEAGLQFFAGYVIEQSLSIDNLFVFLTIFEYFRIPAGRIQQKALAYGLYGAVISRGIFVILGAAFINNFRFALLLFGGILIFASFKLITEGDSDNVDIDDALEDNIIINLVSKQNFIEFTKDNDSDNFFKIEQDGRRLATPLLAAVICLEISDIIFAIDSVPAVFAVSTDPFIVYSSNLFAILGLRAWYQILAVAATQLAYLDKSIAFVLGFVGLKICASFFDFDLPTSTSLAVVAFFLGTGIMLSLLFPPPPSSSSSSGGEEKK
mmetsp:Transcript_62/g.107  ORF Transcript_62/g.107 Transcript_62/m.107 type:complete len:355 (+) Transcript_62:159-1223(+)